MARQKDGERNRSGGSLLACQNLQQQGIIQVSLKNYHPPATSRSGALGKVRSHQYRPVRLRLETICNDWFLLEKTNNI